MNRNFGKLENGALKYAPSVINGDTGLITRPTAADYLAAGYKTVTTSAPTDPAPTGYHYEVDGWEETETAITRKWKSVADPTVYRKFSKLKIYGAIAQLGAWATVQTWLEGKTINGLNGWLAFQLAQEVSEDHPLFAALAEEARQLLGLDSAAFEALLNACLLEE